MGPARRRQDQEIASRPAAGAGVRPGAASNEDHEGIQADLGQRMTKRSARRPPSRFSLEFGNGEFVTFLGPSGCGKSTALNCITGLIPITSGEISIDDECIDDSQEQGPAGEARVRHGLPELRPLPPPQRLQQRGVRASAAQAVEAGRSSDKVTAALRLVHLEGHADKFPAQMSGGEQQRVAIARCIVLEPRLLLLDEPLSNLDAKLRVELRNELKTLHERLQVTTIYVTHDQTEALALSDRIVVHAAGPYPAGRRARGGVRGPGQPVRGGFHGIQERLGAHGESLARQPGTRLEAERREGSELEARLRYPEGDPRRAGLVAAFKAGTAVKTAIRPEDIAVARGRPGDQPCAPVSPSWSTRDRRAT